MNIALAVMAVVAAGARSDHPPFSETRRGHSPAAATTKRVPVSTHVEGAGKGKVAQVNVLDTGKLVASGTGLNIALVARKR